MSERSLKKKMDASCWILLVAAIVLAVAPSRSQVVYAGSSDDPLLPRIGSQPRKTLLKWPGLTPDDNEEPDEPKRLDPDRPHLPEASTTVGKNRLVLESGYTFNEKGSSLRSHSYPEAVLRIGMFADWFEFRLGQNFIDEEQKVSDARRHEKGAQDLYVGVKVALIEQIQYLPAIALIPQMTVPTGSADVTAGRVLPGLNVDCSWQVIKDLFNIELLIATNDVRDDVHRSHVEVATGLTAAANVRRDLEAFVEWDAFYPAGHSTFALRARDYAVGGLVYFLTKNFAIDIRAGVGLNAQANDFLAGTGFATRY